MVLPGCRQKAQGTTKVACTVRFIKGGIRTQFDPVVAKEFIEISSMLMKA